MALGIVCIVTAAMKTNLNLVFAARGAGPETFTIPLVAANNAGATWETTPTHYAMSDAGGDAEELAILQAMTLGDLPPVPEGTVWGQSGVISAANAMACSDGSVFHVYSAAGDIEPVDHVAAVLASEGLKKRPEAPL
jgi:hypothetical protein